MQRKQREQLDLLETSTKDGFSFAVDYVKTYAIPVFSISMYHMINGDVTQQF